MVLTDLIQLGKLTTSLKVAAVNVDKELVERGNDGDQIYAVKQDLDSFLANPTGADNGLNEAGAELDGKGKKKEFEFKIDDDEDGGQVISTA